MKTALFVGDVHAGSFWGLWPREWLPKRTKFSGVSYLLDCWEHMIEWAPPKLDLLVLMGDLIDGKQGKSEGTGLFTASFGEQTDGAVELLRPLASRAARIVRVHGTPYHESMHEALLALDAELGIKRKDTGQVLDLDLGGKVLNIAHHPSGGSGIYRGTQVDKEAVWSGVAVSEGLVRKPTWIASAHRHFYMQQDDGTTVVLQTPPWQLSTPYALKLQRWRFRSKIGAVLMKEDPEHWSGYRFVPQLYDPPKTELLKIA